jgi:guanylate kinase
MKKASYESQALFKLPRSPLLLVLSGPSGAGKDVVLSKLRELNHPLKYITTVTTRSQRAGERANTDYHFVSAEKFQEMISGDKLLEWANVYGNWYGVPKQPIKQALDKGQDTIVKVDVQGAATIKRIIPQAILIFLAPPSIEEIIIRLQQRHTESALDLDLRTKMAKEEMKQLSLFEYLIINNRNEIDQAVSVIEAILTAEKCRVSRRDINL